MRFYVYLFYDPRNDKIYYIGKGQKLRWKTHFTKSSLSNDANKKKVNKILSIIRSNYDPMKYAIFLPCQTEDIAFKLECKLISVFGLKNLCNLTLGGEGISGHHFKRPPFSESHRKKISVANSKKRVIPFTEEHRRKISIANKGKVLSDEQKNKISITQTGKKYSAETNLKKGSHGIKHNHSKIWELTSPTGEIYIAIGNLEHVCKTLNLKHHAIADLGNNKRTLPYNGWNCRIISKENYIQSDH